MKIENYADKYNEITKTLLLDLMENEEGKNIIISPLSILVLLGIVTKSVAGNTKDEVLSFIQDSSGQDIVKLLSTLENKVQESGSLTSGNAVIIAEKLKDKINETYISEVKESFDAEVFSSKDIIRDVNEWVKEKTKGMIDSIADDSMKDMVLALINAISFMADWEEIYDEDDIYLEEFNNLDGSILEVEMMGSTEYSYIENEFYIGFTKAYKGGEFSYMALLPNKKRSKTFFKKAIKSSDLTELFKNAKEIEVHVEIPEYKAGFDAKLNDLLEQKGINQIFTDSADFSPVTEKVPLKTDSILHKAYIEVDRRGTKAAAVTFDYVVCGCLPDQEYKSVILNRPFVYAIMHNETGLPVFAGVVNNL